ncbi:MAG: hypothetical protein IKL89_03090 [Clostridia bacterium]|nr:hypothetical protein [Clostridia bacterium]
MYITKIEALRDEIHLYTDGSGPVTVTEYAATEGGAPARELSRTVCEASGGIIRLPRFRGQEDRIYSRLSVEGASGACFVTDFAPDLAEVGGSYPQPDIIKTLGAPPKLAARLGIPQGRYDVSLPGIMSTVPTEDTLAYVHNGKTYYFLQSALAGLDAHMKSAPVNTLILLNAPRTFGSTGEKALLDTVIHPRFDWDYPDAFISAFNTETEEGLGYYCAFVEFLVERYTRPDGKYGRAAGAIISNEVNSQYVWGNAGEMSAEDYMREYTRAMRMAWICARKHCSWFRVYISLDHFWTGVNFSASQPLRYYPGRKLLELLGTYAREEGDFDWGVAHHPYPESLSFPDFWNDRVPRFSLDTQKITFKNMEVLEAFLSQPEYLYRGQLRRVIFSEQGFNSRSGDLQQLTEKQAAAGYVLAYMKARNMQCVDMFTHHACVDNPHEFGLNLGIFRYDPTAPEGVGEPKPIFDSLMAMDTPKEAEAVAGARAFIGEELFDYLLNPPPVTGAKSPRDVLGNE